MDTSETGTNVNGANNDETNVAVDNFSLSDELHWPASLPNYGESSHSTPANYFEVYTDGSRIEDETGFAVCILRENNNIENHLYKLKSHNSVFQAELAAIHCAANWAASKNVSINIHTDSISSIAAIKSASVRSSFVNNIKQDLVKMKHLVGLSWVKAHVGIQGNRQNLRPPRG
ncbi:hypothetical protein AVEN_270574-1 [Araneus ventricosus]|uniref:RNase H type-1 domain-containing protein n=1 Tax=Araneus ventricosus TaxID=182803 RepID=A0A4Y2B7R0_ARAVE|nr:hypothetical protein AVEN_270574-1 [Araneus ventricosus]